MARVSGGQPGTRHHGADQWLFVVSGLGLEIVESEPVELRKGIFVLIQRGERHEFRNTRDTPLKTLNVYVPPAYTDWGTNCPPGGPDRGR